MLRLLSMSDRAKDAEILALRHQINVLDRQLQREKIRYTPADRALLTALIHLLTLEVLSSIRLLVRPETLLRWHRELIARRHATASRQKRAARRQRSGRSRHWYFALPTRTARGATDASTANCWCWVSR